MADAIVQVRDLRVWFPVRTNFGDLFLGRPRKFVKAVDRISFDLRPGETLALVGESGSGKTTVSRALMGLLPETAGEIWFDGQNILRIPRAERSRVRARIQMIFQDPFEAMNPKETVFKIVSEPLLVHRRDLTPEERKELVSKTLVEVGLSPPQDFLNRYPHELSGGRRQRVLISGALILNPTVIIADEPISMLDASLKVEVLNLLLELQKRRSVTYLMVTHDLALTRYIADRIAIMYLGKILEGGPTNLVVENPLHPYTRALINVVPTLDNVLEKKEVLTGEIPHASAIPEGCRFHPRCSRAKEACLREEPGLREVLPDRWVACHLE